MTSLDNITIQQNCTPMQDLHCLELNFNDTESYEKFSLKYSDLINQLFDDTDSGNNDKKNTLFIHIRYNTLTSLSLNTFRTLDEIKNRSFHHLSFNLNNRVNQLTLSLNRDIINMTFDVLQINIFCNVNGSFQFNYIRRDNESQPPQKKLKCEITTVVSTTPTTSDTVTEMTDLMFSTVSLSTASTKTNMQRFVIISGLIGGGCLIPCFLFACGLYTYCKRKNREYVINNEQSESITNSETDSTESDATSAS